MPLPKRVFIGRKNELDQFQQALGRPGWFDRVLGNPGRGAASRVFLPYGIGGIGKTELTRRCLDLAKEAGWQTLYLDWDRVDSRPNAPLDVMNALAEALKTVLGEGAIRDYLDDRKQTLPLQERVERYRAENPELWQKLVDAAKTATTYLPTLETKALGMGATVLLDYGPRALAKARDLLADKMVEQKKLSQAEALLVKNADIQLARHLVKAITGAAKAQGLVLAFDTCEVLTLALEEFLRDLIVCPCVEGTTGLMVIVSGRYSQYHAREVEDRDGLRKFVKGYADRLTEPPPIPWNLTQFAEPDIAAYLRECGLPDTPEAIDYLQRTARGVPFAMQLLTEALLALGPERLRQDFPPNPEEMDLDSLVRQVVERFLRYCLQDPADQRRVRALALLRTRDDLALRALWQLPEAESVADALAALRVRYGFIQSDGALHEVVADFTRAHLRGDDREAARQLGQVAANHYRPRWEAETAACPLLADRVSEARWQSLTQDMVNALCWGDEQAALSFLAARVVEISLFNPALARGLCKLGRPFREAAEWWPTRLIRQFDMIARAASRPGEAEDPDAVAALEREAAALGLSKLHLFLLRAWRASRLANQGQAAAALAACLQAEQDLPADESLRPVLAQGFERAGSDLGFKLDQAIASPEGLTAYEHAVKLDPSQAGYHNGLGAMQIMLAESPEAHRQALASFSKAIECQPDFAAAYNNRGSTHSALKEYEAALADYDRAIELEPQEASAYYNRGLTQSALNNHQEAIEDYGRAIELDPQLAQAYNSRGLAHHGLKEYPQAIADYDRAIELDPEDASAFYNRGLTHEALEDHARALADFDRAVAAADPQLTQAYNSRGLARHALGQYPEALADYDRAIVLDPHDASAYYNRANTRRALEDYAGALADYDRAIELDPQYPYAYINRGGTHCVLRDYPAALADYARVLELDPQDADAVYNTACVYALQRETALACDWLQRAIGMDEQYREMCRTDSDFDLIREAPEFQALRGAGG